MAAIRLLTITENLLLVLGLAIRDGSGLFMLKKGAFWSSAGSVQPALTPRMSSHQSFNGCVPPSLVLLSSNHPKNQPGEPKRSKLTTCTSGPILAGLPSGRDECSGKEEAGTRAQGGSTHADRIIPRQCRAASWASPFR